MTVSEETWPIGAAVPQIVGTDMDDIPRLRRTAREMQAAHSRRAVGTVT